MVRGGTAPTSHAMSMPVAPAVTRHRMSRDESAGASTAPTTFVPDGSPARPRDHVPRPLQAIVLRSTMQENAAHASARREHGHDVAGRGREQPAQRGERERIRHRRLVRQQRGGVLHRDARRAAAARGRRRHGAAPRRGLRQRPARQLLRVRRGDQLAALTLQGYR